MAFAILGILAAGIVGATLYYRSVLRERIGPRPEATVQAFLTEAFAAKPDAARVEELICEGWNASGAIYTVRSEVPRGVRATWENVQYLSRSDEGRALVSATILLTPLAEEEPSDRHPWTFSLRDEDGWKVCEVIPNT